MWVCYKIVPVSGACSSYLVLELTLYLMGSTKNARAAKSYRLLKNNRCLLSSGSQTCKAFRRPSSWFHSYSWENLIFFIYLFIYFLFCFDVVQAGPRDSCQFSLCYVTNTRVSISCSYRRMVPRLTLYLITFYS